MELQGNSCTSFMSVSRFLYVHDRRRPAYTLSTGRSIRLTVVHFHSLVEVSVRGLQEELCLIFWATRQGYKVPNSRAAWAISGPVHGFLIHLLFVLYDQRCVQGRSVGVSEPNEQASTKALTYMSPVLQLQSFEGHYKSLCRFCQMALIL